jgi:hypothetical protein
VIDNTVSTHTSQSRYYALRNTYPVCIPVTSANLHRFRANTPKPISSLAHPTSNHLSPSFADIELRTSDHHYDITERYYQLNTMSSSITLDAFTHPHPWTPAAIRLSPTPSLLSAQTSITHQLYILDCRGHDARDMQRTLNYITAELRIREVEDLALAEACRQHASTEGKEDENDKDSKTGPWIKKKDGGARMREMEDEDKRWEKESGGNPRWGEGRTAHLYGK